MFVKLKHLLIANSAFAGHDKTDQFFDIVEVIVIAGDPLAMVNNTVFFVLFKAVQQSFETVAADKEREPVRFYFLQESFPALCFGAFIATNELFLARTTPVFTPGDPRTAVGVAAAAAGPFTAKGAGQSAFANTYFTLHLSLLLSLSAILHLSEK